jgi:hypothetical protein
MSKLLQNKAPGVAPHIVAQNTLNIPSQQRINMSKPPPVLMNTTVTVSQAPQVSMSSPTGIQTVNKKSLTTVLDRLSGLKSTIVSKSVSPGLNSGGSSGGNVTNVSSSLVQQLQAPPMLSNPGVSTGHNISRNPKQMSGSPSVGQPGLTSPGNAASQLAGLAGISNTANLFMGLQGASSLVGQSMYPWTAAQQAQAQQAAQAALLLAGAGMPGMNQAAAAAAMHELMKISMSQQSPQQPQPQASPQQSSIAGPRIRAPPPLTHMGRPGHPGSGNQQ